MLVIAYLFLIGGIPTGNADETRYFDAKWHHAGNKGWEYCGAGAGPEGNSGGPVVASGTNAQRGGGAGPRAATMKSGK
jgi:hypothetical protein